MNKRLLGIVSFLDLNDSLIDIGCDHAYVSIWMAKKGCDRVLATDIHPNALKIAKKNIQEQHLENIIKTMETDGLDAIDTHLYNTILISGMGTSTIKHILNADLSKLMPIQKIVLQSNNDLEDLRIFMASIEYKLEDEKVIFDRGHFYVIMKYIKGHKKLNKREILFGLYHEENKEYYLHLKKELESILTKIPNDQWFKKYKIKRKLRYLKKYL